VWNNDVRWTAKQLHLLAVVQARRFSLFGHIARMPDEPNAKKILTAFSVGERPHTSQIKTIHQDLKSDNLSLNEAVDVAQNRPL